MPRESEASSQRRSAVRQQVVVMPRVARVVYTDVAFRPVRLVVTEVSATGLQVRSPDELRAGDLVDLAFELDCELQIQARVLRVRRTERLWEAGCAYEG